MLLRDFFAPDAIALDLAASSRDAALAACVSLLGTDPKTEATLLKVLRRRERVGSTGFGRGIAIPHCRSLVVNRLRVAFGRKPDGVEYNAIDNQPVYNFFLIVAPPLEVSNQYLPVLGKVAQFAKDPEITKRLAALHNPAKFLALLEDKAQ
jgi:mannitol/fructose-specific phosphotransferase system IIA component (Ntr-type)